MVSSVAETRPSIFVSCSINGTSTLDSQRTATGAPAITMRCTASCNASDPHVRTSTMSVSRFSAASKSAIRDTRTIAEVVCGTNESRTVWIRKGVAVSSTITATRTGSSDCLTVLAPSFAISAILFKGTRISAPFYRACVRCLHMDCTIPTLASCISIELEPKLIKGKGMPVIGISPMHMPTFSRT